MNKLESFNYRISDLNRKNKPITNLNYKIDKFINILKYLYIIQINGIQIHQKLEIQDGIQKGNIKRKIQMEFIIFILI